MTNTYAPEGGLKTPEVTRAPFRPRETLNAVTGLVQELEATLAQQNFETKAPVQALYVERGATATCIKPNIENALVVG